MKNFLKLTRLNTSLFKLDLKMKISALLLFTCVFALQANESYSQKTKISLDFNKITVEQFIDEVENRTDFRFLYLIDDVNLKRIVSVKANKENVSSILDRIFAGTKTTYKIDKKQISLVKKEKPKLILKKASIAPVQTIIKGKVTDNDGNPLPGANIIEKGTSNGATTDFNGQFTITANGENPILIVSFIGFTSKEIEVKGRSSIDVALDESAAQLEGVMIVGSRNPNRTSTDTPVAVDVIDVQELATQNGTIEVSRILEIMTPSFNATKQSGSDGADHINPATLRGLGPDQTLVLINGKRRHQSSLVNLFGNRGLGATGTDFNAIPASAIERIEVLRDGAAAQYGSDAIAGVINIVLRKGTGKVTGSVTAGGYNPIAPGDFYEEGTPNTPGNFLETEGDGIQEQSDDPSLDGITYKLDANYGFALGEKGGYANFTTEVINKDKTLRPGADFRRGYGDAAIAGFAFFGNVAVPVNDDTEVYLFGGRNFRDTDAYAFTRRFPNNTDRIVASIYPQGFTPRITSIILDNSLSGGIRKQTENGWSVDFSHTFGKNDFHYFIKGSNNASLGDASPTDFDAGGHTLTQNTTNLDFSRYFESSDGSGINLAFGLEYKTDNFTIFAGEEASYTEYDVNGDPFVSADQIRTGRPGSSQGFGGYSPDTEVDATRSNFAMYADAEYDISQAFLVSAALRFEDYSDFGSTFNWKIASRVKASDNISIRAAISTGFRAPSLAQLNFNTVSTDFEDLDGDGTSEFVESLLAPNNSTITKSFGIPALKEEESFNLSAGFTFKKGGFSATIDGYLIDIADRVVLTRGFSAADFPFLASINVSQAQFFTNAVDTKSTGLDFVLSQKINLTGSSKLNFILAANYNKLEITNINSRGLDPDLIIRRRERSILETGTPKSKYAFNANYDSSKFSATLGFVRYGEVSFYRSDSQQPFYSPATSTNLTITSKFSDHINLTLGANNLFNVYPVNEGPNAGNAFGGGGFQDPVQTGISGAYYFTRLGFSF